MTPLTSFSETRTTEELLPAESEEEKDDEEEEERAFQNRPYPPNTGTSWPVPLARNHKSSILLTGMKNDEHLFAGCC